MKAFIYLRVSTDDKGQDANLQLKDCRNMVIDDHELSEDEVFKEEASAWSDKNRPIFDGMIKRAIAEKPKLIVVWDLDRLYRNRVKMVSFVKEMARANIRVISTRQKWLENLHQIPYPWNEIVFDLVINIIGWMAEEESTKKSERVKLSITTKYGKTMSKNGKKWGRPSITPYQKSKIYGLKKQGLSIRGIAEQMNIKKSTVAKYLK